MQQTIGNIRCFILTPKETISLKKKFRYIFNSRCTVLNSLFQLFQIMQIGMCTLQSGSGKHGTSIGTSLFLPIFCST